ncbi:MAG TPA: hypothetical protein DCG47_01700 [Spirochaetaceae bacterium]|nr:hypothetical protein [Spirochaetaceae bacterium]
MRGPFIGSAGIYDAALRVLNRKWDGRPLRLIGLGLANLGAGEVEQGSLFEDDSDRAAKKSAAVERAVFEASKRGLGKITRARLVPKPEKDKPKK